MEKLLNCVGIVMLILGENKKRCMEISLLKTMKSSLF